MTIDAQVIEYTDDLRTLMMRRLPFQDFHFATWTFLGKDRTAGLQQGIKYIGDLATLNEADLLHVNGIGSVRLKEIQSFLKKNNLSLSMKIPNWHELRPES